MYWKRYIILLFIITGNLLSFHFCCMAEDLPFMDYTGRYPEEQSENHYFLYINDEPLKSPYMALTFTADNKEVVYYFPARDLLDALGVSGTYDKVNNKLIINGKEFPKERAVLGRDPETDEKILYLPFKEVLQFLNLPMRIQEKTLGITIYVKTDSLNNSLPVNVETGEKTITWYTSIKDAQAVAQGQGKKILVKFGATW